MRRPRILFWSRQNSYLGDPDLLGIGLPGSASMFTISRARPRPCVLLSQRCFASLSQASRIAAQSCAHAPGADLNAGASPRPVFLSASAGAASCDSAFPTPSLWDDADGAGRANL